jgi:geranylgeranyl diphosphate synthase, type I
VAPAPDVIAAVSQRLDNFLQIQHDDAAPLGSEARLITAVGADSVTGGKRLRARFLLAGWRSVTGSEPSSAAVAAAAALEIFHAAALVHDDVIDNSDTRRGKPAAHRALEAHHRDAMWEGDAESFGRAGAVLLGDLLVAWSDDLFEEGLAEASDDAASAARAEYATMRRQVTIGQFLDVAEESAFRTEPDDRHAERALRVASLKSARYSVQQPLLIGAALGEADAGQRDALSSFGHPLGMAYQLRDDVLGVFGDPGLTGKPAGDDLREGKRTVLMALALDVADTDQLALMDKLFGQPDLDVRGVDQLRGVLLDTGAVDELERRIAALAEESRAALHRAKLLEQGAAGVLDRLIETTTTRSA